MKRNSNNLKRAPRMKKKKRKSVKHSKRTSNNINKKSTKYSRKRVGAVKGTKCRSNANINLMNRTRLSKIRKINKRLNKHTIMSGNGEYSYGSKVPSRHILKQNGKGAYIRQRGYGPYIAQRGYGQYQFPNQHGAGIGSLFRSFIRIAKPLLSRGIQLAKPHAMRAGKELVKEVVHSGKDVVSDILASEDPKTSIKKRSKEAGKRIGRKSLNTLMRQL